jgi:nucleoid-associated protein YgaU
MYAAGTLLAVIVLIVGAAMLRNYDQMKSMQETLNYLTQNMKETGGIDAEAGDKNKNKNSPATVIPSAGASKNKEKSEEEGLDVQVVPGNVEPVKGADSQSGKEDSGEAADSAKENDNEKENDSGTTSDKDLAGNAAKSSDASASDTGTKKAGTDVKKPDTSKSAKAASTDKVKYYTVKDGDTLADISYKLYSTYTKVDAIMKLNGITDQNVIFSGQKLKVP